MLFSHQVKLCNNDDSIKQSQSVLDTYADLTKGYKVKNKKKARKKIKYNNHHLLNSIKQGYISNQPDNNLLTYNFAILMYESMHSALSILHAALILLQLRSDACSIASLKFVAVCYAVVSCHLFASQVHVLSH